MSNYFAADYEKYRHDLRVRKLENGNIDGAVLGLVPKGFKCILMKSYFTFMGMTDYSYSVICAKRVRGRLRLLCKDITQDDAKIVKDALGLRLTLRNKYGKIYDTPDLSFLRLFPNGASLTEQRMIDNILA